MIFKTITDETTLSGQRIVGVLQARKIAQEQALKQTNLDIQCLKNYETACKNGVVSSDNFARIMSQASTQAQEYSKNIKEGTGSAQIYADKQKILKQSIQNTGTASKVAAVGVKALSIAGNMLAGIAISFAISKVIEGIEYLVTASERAIEKTKELQQEISKISSDYQSERQTLEGLRKEYDTLTSKIGENGVEASLSADEYKRYRDITSEILGITPKLITGWDEEGRAISNKNNLLQMSIDLLDEEYQKSLRNSTTKTKNEEVAAGIIASKEEFDNSGDTKTISGTKYDLVWKDLKDYVDKAVADKKINYTYKSTGIVGKGDADAAYAINAFVYGDSLYEATELNTVYGWLGSLQERITSSKENFEKFANSLSNEDNPIYQWFTNEQINELIRDADEYFQELARIEGEEQQYFQQYKDQLNLNAQAVGDAYSDLDELTKAGITQMIDSFDYSDMTKEKFSDMATDLKDFVRKLFTDDILLSYFNNLFKPMGEDESIEDYETRVKTGIDEITSYCESNYPAIKLSFGDVESDVENLKEKYNTAISKFVGKANDVDLVKFFENNSINDESEIDYWNKVTEGAKTASEAVQMYEKALESASNPAEPLNISSWFSTHKDTIDDFQSKMKTLGDTLSSIRSGSLEDSDLTDLLQEFPELADKTDDLETAITELINNSLEQLYATLGEEIPEGLKSSLQEITNLALGTATHLSDAFSSIHDSWDILQDFKEAMEEGFDDNVTDDLLQSVRGLSGELETLVAGYYSGVVTAEELYDALTRHYENDLHNYSEALIKKNELNETFYNAVGMASEEVTNQFMNDYNVDLKNCKNYNQAKLEIEKQTLGEISGAWSQYYNAQSQTLKMSMGEIEARAAHGGGDAAAFLKQYELIENYEKAMAALDKIAYDGIRSNFDSIGSKLDRNKDSSKDSKDTTETFNWIETAVSRIQRVITNLGNAVSATWRSWTHRNTSLASELAEVRKEIELQQSAYEAYMKKAESVSLSDHYKNLVRNGDLSIEDIADETLKEQIKEYQEWWIFATLSSNRQVKFYLMLEHPQSLVNYNVSMKYGYA